MGGMIHAERAFQAQMIPASFPGLSHGKKGIATGIVVKFKLNEKSE
jgi:hypothetical protein